jgi:hypothetical protein
MRTRTTFFLGLASVVSCLVATASDARADEIRSAGNFGLGLGVSTFAAPLSGKYFLGDEHALQFNAGFFQDDLDFEGKGLGLGLDYLYEMPPIAEGDKLEFAWSLGFGPALGIIDEHTAIAAVGVVGLEFNIKPVPMDVVLEYRPHLLLNPDTDLDLTEFGGHVRYYF